MLQIQNIKIPQESLDILEVVSGQGFIAGGYARWVVTGYKDPVASDIDIFHYKQNMEYLAVDTDVFELSDPIVSALEELGYVVTRDLPNAIEMKMMAMQECSEAQYKSLVNKRAQGIVIGMRYFKFVPVANYLPVQVIKPFVSTIPRYESYNPVTGEKVAYESRESMRTFGAVSDVIRQFDFPQAMAALEYYSWQPPHPKSIGSVLVTTDARFLPSIESGQLEVTHINCPIAVTMRALKYVSKGYSIRPREIVKLFKDWDNRPPAYKSRLIELCERDTLEAREWFELEQLLRID